MSTHWREMKINVNANFVYYFEAITFNLCNNHAAVEWEERFRGLRVEGFES